MKTNEEYFAVRTGKGTINGSSFTDVVEWVTRSTTQHSGWKSVRYKGKRYQLLGGFRTCYFICLDKPLTRRYRDA